MPATLSTGTRTAHLHSPVSQATPSTVGALPGCGTDRVVWNRITKLSIFCARMPGALR